MAKRRDIKDLERLHDIIGYLLEDAELEPAIVAETISDRRHTVNAATVSSWREPGSTNDFEPNVHGPRLIRLVFLMDALADYNHNEAVTILRHAKGPFGPQSLQDVIREDMGREFEERLHALRSGRGNPYGTERG
jgi:hypothetical protein